MADDSDRSWIYSKIENEDHAALHAIATEEGKHITKIVEMACQYFIVHWAETHKTVPRTMIRMMLLQSRNKQNEFSMLKQLAYTWNDTQSDDDYKTLLQACEVADVDVEVVMEAINKNISLSGVINKVSNGLEAAIIFLADNMMEGKHYPVSEIQSMTEERGLKWHTVAAAKRKLNIVSVKDGVYWYWVRQTEIEKLMQEDD